jgi:O-Antigen ligase
MHSTERKMKNIRTGHERLFAGLLFISGAGLLSIWPLPGTMALRNLLLLAGGLSSIYLFRRDKEAFRTALRANLPLMLFFAWAIAHYFFLAQIKEMQWKELTGFWLRSGLSTLIGAGIGVLLSRKSSREDECSKPGSALVLQLSIYTSLGVYLLRYLYELAFSQGAFPMDFYMTPFGGKPQIVVFIGIAFIAALTHLLMGLESPNWKRKVILPAFTMGLSLLCFYFANTKNGFLISFVILIGVLLLTLKKDYYSPKIKLAIVAAAIPLAVVGGMHMTENAAWHTAYADIKTGVAISEQTYWKDWVTQALPLNENAQAVNQSTYLRVAWLTAALQLIQETPWGYGLMSYSFSYLAKEKWPDFYSKEGDHMVATHSGWMDLTLGLGIPATLLVFLSLITSSRNALKRAGPGGFWSKYSILMPPFFLLSFLTVEVSYDIFFELLFFFCALFGSLNYRRT